jgi:predicted dehydrogenase
VITPKVDIANARLEFDCGCVANLTASRISNKRVRKIRVFQREAYYSIDCYRHSLYVITRTEPGESGRPGTAGREIAVNYSDALEEELKNFTEAVTSKSPPAVTGEDGRRALAVALDINADINTRNGVWKESVR